MEEKKFNWILSIIREQMVTGSTAAAPGFSVEADPKGPTAGFDPLIGFKRRKGPQIKLPPGSRKRWSAGRDK